MKLATLMISASLFAAPAFAGECSSKNKAHATPASYTTAVAGETYTKVKTDIVETAQAAGSFNTLLAAADAAGLVGATARIKNKITIATALKFLINCFL